MIRKLLATREIYWIIKRVIRSRREGGIAHHDTLQILLDHEDDDMLIVGVRMVFYDVLVVELTHGKQFIMGLIVAGARATGTAGACSALPTPLSFSHLLSASWLHVYMGQDPIWQEKVKLEVDDLLQKYAFVDTKDGRHDISEQLSSVPLHAWENDMPVMDMLIRETLRVCTQSTLSWPSTLTLLGFLGRAASHCDEEKHGRRILAGRPKDPRRGVPHVSIQRRSSRS